MLLKIEKKLFLETKDFNNDRRSNWICFIKKGF